MNHLKQFPQIEAQIIKCMMCGNCQAVCPLYKETNSETAVARGKIKLAQAVLNGELEYTDELAKIFDTCLQCKACTANCPCGVEPDTIVLAARAKLARERGVPTLKKLIFKGLSSPGLFKTGMSLGASTQGLFFKKSEDGMSPRVPISGLTLRRVIPQLASKPFLKSLPAHSTVSNPKKRVAFFAGCTANFIYPQVGQALVEVMKHNQIELVVPRNQHCCGTPVLMHGDVKTAVQMAKSQVDIFEKYDLDAIITVCGTCGEAFKKYYPHLLKDDPVYSEKAERLAAKTYDFAQFIVNVVGLDKSKLGSVDATVTYHVPCHIGRGMNAAQQQLEIIKSIPGLKYHAMQEPERCCGGAGSFSLTHYDLSYHVLKHKLRDIDTTEADYLITGCGSCRMQLGDGLAQEKMPQQILHTVELLAKSYQNAN